MAKKKPNKSPRKEAAQKKPVKKAAKPAEKQAAKPPAEKPAEKPAKGPVDVTPKLRRIWLRVRKAYNLDLTAFSNTLSFLTDEEANMLYDMVRHALFKGSVAEILREHPELRELVRTDDDRLCMYDIYEYLSWRLGKSEPMPEDRKVITRFRKAVKGTLIP